MKYVVISLQPSPNANAAELNYPDAYNAVAVQKSKLGPLVYSRAIQRGQFTGEMLCYLSDSLADGYLADARCREITEAEDDHWIEEEEQDFPSEFVNDLSRITLIQTKILAAIELSDEDKLALDETSSVPGVVTRSTKAADRFR